MAEESAAAEAVRSAADAKLKRESDLAKAAIAAREMGLAPAMAQLVLEATDVAAVCGGLLVLLQLHPAASLLQPLMLAIFESGRQMEASAAVIAAGSNLSPEALSLPFQAPLVSTLTHQHVIPSSHRLIISVLLQASAHQPRPKGHLLS